MAINQDRPIITYENIALFQSDAPAHSVASNSGDGLSFLPLVQGISFSVDIPRTNAGALGTKGFIDQSNRNAPDVQFSVNTIEDFGNLFSGLLTGSEVRENLNIDRNFYAAIGNERGFDISGENLSGRDVLSFGNCFLDGVSISQSVGGLMTSSYNFVGSNVQAQQLDQTASIFSGESPSIDLTGNQAQDAAVVFEGMDSYYSNETGKLIPYYSTNVTISGEQSSGTFLIESDSIQNFDLNLPINRKTIYSLGKKYPVKRKALFPSEGSFTFSNRVSNFKVSGDKANLKDFLNSDESYTLGISGENQSGGSFDLQITDARLNSQSYDSSVGSDIVANLGFSFELNKFSKIAGQVAAPLPDLYLNIFGGDLAYSFQRLDKNYTGYAFRVRRDIDDELADVDFNESGVVDLDSPIVTLGSSTATTLGGFVVGGDNAHVNIWYDQASGGVDLSQSDSSKQPQIMSNGQMMDGGVNFGGGIYDYELQSTVNCGLDSSQKSSVMIATYRDTNSAFAFAVDGGGASSDNYLVGKASNGRHILANNTLQFSSNNAYDAGNPFLGTDPQEFLLTTNITDSVYYSGRHNGSTVIQGDGGFALVGNNSGDGVLKMGVGKFNGNDFRLADCAVRELILYNSDEGANMTGMENNVANRYGISLS